MYKSVKDFVQTAPSIEATPIFVYKFSFKGPISYSLAFTNTAIDFGVVHLDDTLYLFQNEFFPPPAPQTPEANMTQMFVQYFVDFAVKG